MRLYLKLNSIGLFRALDDLLPKARSEIADALRSLRDAPNGVDYETNLNAGDTLTRLSQSLFYSDRDLRALTTGVYFGSDTCEHLLPYPRHIDEVMDYCARYKLHCALVLPPLSDKYLGHAERAMEQLDMYNAEVVVNDFGALNLACQKPGLTVTLGRLFNKVQRNAFIDRLAPDDATPEQLANQALARGLPEFSDAGVRTFLKSLGVGRVGVENQGYNLSFANDVPRMNLDVYFPYRYLSSSRACDTAGAFDLKRAHFPSDECSRYCEKTAIQFPEGRLMGLIHRNNAFYTVEKRLELPSSVTKNKRNRLVYEPML